MQLSIRTIFILTVIGLTLVAVACKQKQEPGEELLGIYVQAEGSIVHGAEGITYILEISCGFDTEAEALANLDQIVFTVTINGTALQPIMANDIFAGGGQWHVYTRYSTGKLSVGTYIIVGTTVKKPDTVIGTRTFTIVIE